MDQELQDFISNYLELAKFRNVSDTNPIRFEIQPEQGNANKIFIVVVAPNEPTFSKLPYNVLWIISDTNHPAYMSVLRRTGHLAADIYNASWETMTAYSDLWTPDQYYQFVVEDPRLHGVDSEDSVSGPATATEHGLAVLSAPQAESIVVELADVRNSNARYPNFHTHADFPRTMIKINETDYALVNTSAPPQQGMMLFVVGQSDTKPNEYIAVWKFPVESDLLVIDRSLLGIRINGVSSMPEQTMQPYTVDAVYADGTEKRITPNSFTVSDVGTAQMDTSTQILSAGNVTSTRNITLSASYTEDGITVTDSHPVEITTGVELTSIQIVGPDIVDEGTEQQYIVRAFFNDGSNQDVMADDIASSVESYATVDIAALLTAKEVNGGDKNTVLAAEYTFDEVRRTASKTVTIRDLDPLVNNIVINGPDVLEENTSASYTFTLVYSDGTEVENAVPASFTQNINTYSDINDTSYTLDANEVTADRVVRLDATYTEFGRTVSGFLNVTITNRPAQPQSAEIVGADSIPEGDSSAYVLRVTFDDNSTQDFIDSNWVITSGQTYASVLTSGIVTGADITQDRTVTLEASRTVSGVEFNGITKDITILAESPVPVSLDITAPNGSSANEGETVVLNYVVTYDNGSTVNVKSSPLLAESFVGNSRNSTFTGADNNDVLMGEVTGNQSITVRGSYTEDGTTVTDTIALGIVDSDVTPRWGTGVEQNLKSDYATPEFYDTLPNELTGVNNETVALVFTEAADGQNNFGYIFYPAAWGYAFITNTDNNDTGGWDFASLTTSDATFNDGPVEASVGGTTYYVYRTDFSLDPGTYNFKIEYGGSTPSSSAR